MDAGSLLLSALGITPEPPAQPEPIETGLGLELRIAFAFGQLCNAPDRQSQQSAWTDLVDLLHRRDPSVIASLEAERLERAGA